MSRGTVSILTGPKGAGKTFIGDVLDRERGLPFLRVEPIFLDVIEEAGARNDEVFARGFQRVAEEIHARLAEGGSVVIESTAAWHRFGDFLAELRAHHDVRLVAVHTPADQCLERARTRDQTDHIPVSDQEIHRINTVARAAELSVVGALENPDGTNVEALLRQWDTIGTISPA